MVKVARELECVVLEEPRKAFDLFVRAEKQCCALTKDVHCRSGEETKCQSWGDCFGGAEGKSNFVVKRGPM